MESKGVRFYLETHLNSNIKDKVLKMYDDLQEDFAYWPASIRFHHNKKNGLAQHTEEVLYCALKIFKTFEEELRKRLIVVSDIVLVAFIHDLEKLTKYKENNDYDEDKFQPNVYEFKYNYSKIDVHDSAKVVNLCSKYGIVLSDKQLNALSYHHGGWTKDIGQLEPLAALIHMADLMSSNVIYIKEY